MTVCNVVSHTVLICYLLQAQGQRGDPLKYNWQQLVLQTESESNGKLTFFWYHGPVCWAALACCLQAQDPQMKSQYDNKTTKGHTNKQNKTIKDHTRERYKKTPTKTDKYDCNKQ